MLPLHPPRHLAVQRLQRPLGGATADAAPTPSAGGWTLRQAARGVMQRGTR
jgi:hypothetical protein